MSQLNTWPSRVRAATVRHPQVVDALLGALVGGLALLAVLEGPGGTPGRSLTGLDVLFAAIATLLVTLRRRWPVPALAVVTVAAVWAEAVRGEVYVLTAMSVLCAYTVAS